VHPQGLSDLLSLLCRIHGATEAERGGEERESTGPCLKCQPDGHLQALASPSLSEKEVPSQSQTRVGMRPSNSLPAAPAHAIPHPTEEHVCVCVHTRTCTHVLCSVFSLLSVSSVCSIPDPFETTACLRGAWDLRGLAEHPQSPRHCSLWLQMRRCKRTSPKTRVGGGQPRELRRGRSASFWNHCASQRSPTLASFRSQLQHL
jgi:hypothetical protein